MSNTYWALGGAGVVPFALMWQNRRLRGYFFISNILFQVGEDRDKENRIFVYSNTVWIKVQ